MMRYARKLYRERRAELHTATVADYNGQRFPFQPRTDANSRKHWRDIRNSYAAELTRAQAELKTALWRLPAAPYGYGAYQSGAYAQTDHETFERKQAARVRKWKRHIYYARQSLARVQKDGAHDSLGFRNARHARDIYRKREGFALAQWRDALLSARLKFEPFALAHSEFRQNERERVRNALAIYGTAHSATEIVRVRGGATYARGIARHVPDLERGRNGGRDHSPLTLGDGETFYLAVRNTVPRQNRPHVRNA
jgi:hypothetical protein